MKSKLICALDFKNKNEVETFLKKVGAELDWVKVGMELYYKEGASIVSLLKDRGYKVFLDLKLHDIPNTVEKATRNLLEEPIDMLNFHAAGGSEMLQRVARIENKSTLLIGVTQLTSTSEEQMQKEQGIQLSLKESVLKYADLCMNSGLDGVVCSPHEVRDIKEKYAKAITVCPGVRLKGAESHDQVRIMSPKEAIQVGADYLVIGRNITEANDPKKILSQIYQEMSEA